MMHHFSPIGFLILLLLPLSILGCITNQQNNGLVIALQADPSTVFQQGISKVHVDVTNTDLKQVDNVRVELFNAGIMTAENAELCKQSGNLGFLRPQEFRTFSCDFIAPQINNNRVTARLDAKASFDSELSAVQQMELLTEQEYNNRLATSSIRYLPQSYTYSDRNLELKVDFSEALPVVIKNGRQVFVRFTLKNIGNGFIDTIRPEDVEIIQSPINEVERNILQVQISGSQGNYEKCRLKESLSPIGKDFPSFACQIFMPDNIPAITNYNFIINIKYHYEIRNSVNIDVIR